MLAATPQADEPRSGYQPYPLACAYRSRTGLEDAAACAADIPGGLALAPAVVAGLDYEKGLAEIAIVGRGWYYRRRDGRALLMMTLDMGPDDFVEGLARTYAGGKLAYADRRLRIRLATRYDWGEPFSHGRANVCIGCVEQKVDGGEHSVMVGGDRGVIDRHGREIVPLAPRRE